MTTSPMILGDSAYADGRRAKALGEAGFTLMAKCPPMRNCDRGVHQGPLRGRPRASTVTCPAGQVALITRRSDGSGLARFAPHCRTCPLRVACTTSRAGRSVAIHEHEAILQHARAEQPSPSWIATYRANRPLVERKIAHLVRRGWGGRRGTDPRTDASPPTSTRERARSTGHVSRPSGSPRGQRMGARKC